MRKKTEKECRDRLSGFNLNKEALKLFNSGTVPVWDTKTGRISEPDKNDLAHLDYVKKIYKCSPYLIARFEDNKGKYDVFCSVDDDEFGWNVERELNGFLEKNEPFVGLYGWVYDYSYNEFTDPDDCPELLTTVFYEGCVVKILENTHRYVYTDFHLLQSEQSETDLSDKPF